MDACFAPESGRVRRNDECLLRAISGLCPHSDYEDFVTVSTGSGDRLKSDGIGGKRLAVSKICNVLFLCTGNSARSIIAEAILNRNGGGTFRAYSAGSQPKGDVNPNTINLLRELGYDTSTFRSKSWNEFAQNKDLPIDYVITVCNNAAGEACPIIPGKSAKQHWDIPDPAAVTGTQDEIEKAFKDVHAMLSDRIEALVKAAQ